MKLYEYFLDIMDSNARIGSYWFQVEMLGGNHIIIDSKESFLTNVKKYTLSIYLNNKGSILEIGCLSHKNTNKI